MKQLKQYPNDLWQVLTRETINGIKPKVLEQLTKELWNKVWSDHWDWTWNDVKRQLWHEITKNNED